MKRECEDILQVTRNSAEKHFQELIKLYETARVKVHNIIINNKLIFIITDNCNFKSQNIFHIFKKEILIKNQIKENSK